MDLLNLWHEASFNLHNDRMTSLTIAEKAAEGSRDGGEQMG